MIAYIKGIFEQTLDQAAIVDVHGIGYLVHISPATASRLPSRGQEVKLFTYMNVKEDGVSLHGFLTQEEVRLFTLLISVSGIGPKVATAILATLTPAQVMMAIIADDAAALSKAPGVGRKTAQRIALELRDKIKTQEAPESGAAVSADIYAGSVASEKKDALDALLVLGYSRAESYKAVLETAEEGMSTEQIIRLSLKKLHTT
ncbi:MAG: Holliday junction branch migration protein RuvA [Clostridiales bacterium]|jgi:Holliday junction DNA helicase RuvA|nr:Holliday junction branch migration protein RuvA [Clostridiales bacterium]